MSTIEIDAILNGSPIPTFVINKNNEVVHWNQSCELVTGIHSHQVMGTTEAWKGFYPSPRPVLANFALIQNIEGAMHLYAKNNCSLSKMIPFAYEAIDFFEHMGKSGKWLYFTAAPLFDENGEIIGAIETLQDITEQKEAEERVKKIAYYDCLTCLPNRVLFSDRMNQAIARSDRNGRWLIVGYMDLDGFKDINDKYGHGAGDTVLINVTKKSSKELRMYDTIARIGGDEFAILLSDIVSENEGLEILNRLIKSIEEPMIVQEIEMFVSASIGFIIYQPKCELEADILLRYADQAMYKAKKNGKNQIQMFKEE